MFAHLWVVYVSLSYTLSLSLSTSRTAVFTVGQNANEAALWSKELVQLPQLPPKEAWEHHKCLCVCVCVFPVCCSRPPAVKAETTALTRLGLQTHPQVNSHHVTNALHLTASFSCLFADSLIMFCLPRLLSPSLSLFLTFRQNRPCFGILTQWSFRKPSLEKSTY